MRLWNVVAVVLLGGALTLSGCKSSRKVTEARPDAAALSDVQHVERVIAGSPQADCIDAKMRFTLRMGDKELSVGGNLRMKRDDVIQLSLVGFGIIEGGRIEFTRDSVLLLDRIHRCYVRMAYRDVEFLRDSGADFYTLQALFWNELVLPGVRHVTAGEASRFHVSRRPDGRVVLSGDERGALACRFVTSLAGALLEQTEISTASGKALVWTYGDFVRMGTGHYPGRMEIVLRGQDMPVTAVIALSRIGTGDGWATRTPVSARYRRMDARSLIRELMQM